MPASMRDELDVFANVIVLSLIGVFEQETAAGEADGRAAHSGALYRALA